jgi:hypothetical protein
MPFQPKIQLSLDSILTTLSPSLRHLVMQQLQMAQLLQHRPVILAAPYVITIK